MAAIYPGSSDTPPDQGLHLACRPCRPAAGHHSPLGAYCRTAALTSADKADFTVQVARYAGLKLLSPPSNRSRRPHLDHLSDLLAASRREHAAEPPTAPGPAGTGQCGLTAAKISDGPVPRPAGSCRAQLRLVRVRNTAVPAPIQRLGHGPANLPRLALRERIYEDAFSRVGRSRRSPEDTGPAEKTGALPTAWLPPAPSTGYWELGWTSLLPNRSPRHRLRNLQLWVSRADVACDADTTRPARPGDTVWFGCPRLLRPIARLLQRVQRPSGTGSRRPRGALLRITPTVLRPPCTS